MGCDAATDFALLRGFREWLVVTIDGPNNFHWMGLFPIAHLPEERRSGPFTKEEDRVLVDALFDAVIRYLDESYQVGGDARIFERYIQWRDSKPWHDMDPIGSLNEVEGRIDSLPAAHASEEAHEVHRIRGVPVSRLSATECAKFVRLWLSIETIVPRATQLLAEAAPEPPADNLVELLHALIALGPEWWADHPSYFGDLVRALSDSRLDDDVAHSWADLLAAVGSARTDADG
jgi:hypothetical protein